MISLPDFSKCVEFQRLREKMGVTVIPHVPRVKFSRKIKKQKEIIEPNTETIHIENKLKKDSIDVISADIIPDKDGLLTYKGRKVAAYIRDQRTGIDFYRKISEYKYHLYDCSTLKRMREIGKQRRYLVTKRDDGFFSVNDVSGHSPRSFDAKLELCQNCLRELRYLGIYTSPFSLGKYFEKNDSFVPETIRRIETVTEIQTYTPNQNELSSLYKKTVNYICQSCGVDCNSQTSLLHLHHRDSDPSNNEYGNLSVLCVDCHSKQPMHAHVANTQRAKQEITVIKKLRTEQGISDLGISI